MIELEGPPPLKIRPPRLMVGRGEEGSRRHLQLSCHRQLPPHSLDALRLNALALEPVMMAYCFDRKSRITNAHAAIISDKAREVGKIISDLLLRNTFLERLVAELDRIRATTPVTSTSDPMGLASRPN